MDVIKLVWESGAFPNFFEMIGFSDLARMAMTWERERGSFQEEVEKLGAELENRKMVYAGECALLPGRVARVEQIFLRAWGLSDEHLRNLLPAAPPPANHTPAACQALNINDEEMAEIEQGIAAISATVRQTPLRRIAAPRPLHASASRQFTAFAPLASTHWVEHTSTGFGHCIWKLDTYNHLAPISVKAYQFLAGPTDAQVRKCKAIAYTAQLKFCGKSVSPFSPDDLSFPLMSYIDPEKCGQTAPVMCHKAIKQTPALDLRNLRKVWSAGRPYVKCSCKPSDEDKDCPGGPLWVDHAIWYLLAHPDVLFPTMSSTKIRTSMLVHYLRTTWKDAVIGCIIFMFIKEIMTDFVKYLEADDQLSVEGVIKDERMWRQQLPPAIGRILLPTRIPARPRRVTPAARQRAQSGLIQGQGRLNFPAANKAINNGEAPEDVQRRVAMINRRNIAAAQAQQQQQRNQQAEGSPPQAPHIQQRDRERSGAQGNALGNHGQRQREGEGSSEHQQAIGGANDGGMSQQTLVVARQNDARLTAARRDGSGPSSRSPTPATPMTGLSGPTNAPSKSSRRRSPDDGSGLDSEHSHFGRRLRPRLSGSSSSADPRCNKDTRVGGQMVIRPTGRSVWCRERHNGLTFLHMTYTSRAMEAFSVRRLVLSELKRLVGEGVKEWLEKVVFGWTYEKPVAAYVCRPKEVFKNFDIEHWTDHYDQANCHCRTDRKLVLDKARSKMNGYISKHRFISAEPIDQTSTRQDIDFLTERFLVAPTYKYANTPSFVCTNFIRVLALRRLQGADFVLQQEDPEQLIPVMKEQLNNLPALSVPRDALPYLMTVYKAHKQSFRWITNTADTVVSPMADLCACLLRFLTPSVQSYCSEMSKIMEAEYDVRPNLWWPISSVGELAANLPRSIHAVYTTDITRCFETIPTDDSEHGLLTAIRFFVETALSHRRDRSSRDVIKNRSVTDSEGSAKAQACNLDGPRGGHHLGTGEARELTTPVPDPVGARKMRSEQQLAASKTDLDDNRGAYAASSCAFLAYLALLACIVLLCFIASLPPPPTDQPPRTSEGPARGIMDLFATTAASSSSCAQDPSPVTLHSPLQSPLEPSLAADARHPSQTPTGWQSADTPSRNNEHAALDAIVLILAMLLNVIICGMAVWICQSQLVLLAPARRAATLLYLTIGYTFLALSAGRLIAVYWIS
ncbi:hypothetical protein CBR_g39112 [Chara braunii]|uniref:Uncharacterized protein n=1 Tax=Chara braunii TaxID=69332 RepID=A0A388LR51_CHABU|nr:hypothetical protein CBR_g39112 [Chara braunii]|eukprot:GBG84735.1 hypothetical protein CBR_g39112 [Chara braunii]